MCTKKEKINYEFQSEVSRGVRDEIINSSKKLLESQLYRLDSMVERWNGLGSKDIKKKDLKEFPKHKWIELSPGVKIKRREDVYGIIIFDTIIDKGAKFGLHMHSDCDEVCDVISGELYNAVTDTRYDRSDTMTIIKGDMHQPIALENTVLVVYFK